MAKRFTDTEKWKKPFIRGLDTPYKLLWFYILDDCDHAGIWQVDIEVAEIRIGEKLSKCYAIDCFEGRVIKISEGKWFIPDFIEFQYGELTEKNRMHNSVIQILTRNGIDYQNINKPLTSPLQGVKDKDKDKVKDKEQEKDKDKDSDFEILEYPAFSDFWDMYDKKRGDKEKVQKKWKQLTQKDKEAIMEYLPAYLLSTPDKQFRKDPLTFLNNKSWNDEIITATTQNNKQPRKLNFTMEQLDPTGILRDSINSEG